VHFLFKEMLNGNPTDVISAKQSFVSATANDCTDRNQNTNTKSNSTSSSPTPNRNPLTRSLPYQY